MRCDPTFRMVVSLTFGDLIAQGHPSQRSRVPRLRLSVSRKGYKFRAIDRGWRACDTTVLAPKPTMIIGQRHATIRGADSRWNSPQSCRAWKFAAPSFEIPTFRSSASRAHSATSSNLRQNKCTASERTHGTRDGPNVMIGAVRFDLLEAPYLGG